MVNSAEISTNEIGRAMRVVDVVVAAGFAKSKSEARRLVEGGAIRVNDVKTVNPRDYLVFLRDGTSGLSREEDTVTVEVDMTR